MSEEEDISDLDESQDDEGGEEALEEGDEEAEEEGEEEHEEEEKIPENPLTDDHIRESLTMLSKIGRGLQHAYITMNVTNKEITDVEKACTLIHLRHVDFSFNSLKDISPLSSLSQLLTLKVDENSLTKVDLEELEYLQIASFVRNRIDTLEGLTHPMLNKLFLSYNEIQRSAFADPQRLSCLTFVDLSNNRLETLTGEFPPNLQELYLAANLISSFGPIRGLQKLRVLHMRDNQLSQLDGIADAGLDSLTYFNLRGNSVEDPNEASKISAMTHIKALILQENPVHESEDYRIEILAALKAPRSLMRLDKEDVTFEELEEAEELMAEQEEKRREEDEERRKEEEERREEEERLREEEEAKEDGRQEEEKEVNM